MITISSKIAITRQYYSCIIIIIIAFITLYYYIYAIHFGTIRFYFNILPIESTRCKFNVTIRRI